MINKYLKEHNYNKDNVLGIGLGVFSALIPAYQAARKDPVKCLKDE